MNEKENCFVEKLCELVAKYPLQVVEIEHVLLDIDVIDSRTGTALGRPWLTLGIDVFSRRICCMHLSFEPPSGNTLLCAVENGVFPKDSKGRFRTTNEWEVHGVPDILSVDNGLPFRTV